jgi:hypothetical protein
VNFVLLDRLSHDGNDGFNGRASGFFASELADGNWNVRVNVQDSISPVFDISDLLWVGFGLVLGEEVHKRE